MNEKNRTHLCFTFNSYFAFFTLFFFQLNWFKSVWITFNINNCTWKEERYNKIDVNVLFVPNWKGILRRIILSLSELAIFFVLQCFYETLLCLDHVSCSIFFSLLQFHLILYPFINSVMSFVFPFGIYICSLSTRSTDIIIKLCLPFLFSYLQKSQQISSIFNDDDIFVSIVISSLPLFNDSHVDTFLIQFSCG